MYRAAVISLIAEIHPPGFLTIVRHMDCMTHQLVHALVFCRRDGHYRNAQISFHLVDMYGTAVTPHLVHHIERQHHGDPQFHQLHGQIEIPLDIGGVHDIDNTRRFFAYDKLSCDDLLRTVGGHGIDTRQIGDLRLRVAPDGAAFPVHRHPRKVPHMLVCAGELIKERGLAAILVARQSEGQHAPLGQGIAVPPGVISAALPQARMLRPGLPSVRFIGESRISFCLFPNRGHLYFCRVVKPQCQLVAVDQQLHRIPHRGELDKLHLRAGDQSHIQKMLSEGAFPAHRFDLCRLSDLQIIQHHYLFCHTLFRHLPAIVREILSFHSASSFSHFELLGISEQLPALSVLRHSPAPVSSAASCPSIISPSPAGSSAASCVSITGVIPSSFAFTIFSAPSPGT